jgi:hypothetical protein
VQDRQLQYDAFVKSEFGKHFLETLQKLSDTLIREAQTAQTADVAYGLIKESSGVIKVIDHIKVGSVLK